MKKQVLPVLRRPLYFGFDGRIRGFGAEESDEALEEWIEPEEGAAERARRNDCALSEEADWVYGWRRDVACRPGLSISLYAAKARRAMSRVPIASSAWIGSVVGIGKTPKRG